MQEEPTADETDGGSPASMADQGDTSGGATEGEACPGAELSGGGGAGAPEISREAAAGSANP
eukprot:4917077-Lingulodinium_polyedra.AAC.1